MDSSDKQSFFLRTLQTGCHFNTCYVELSLRDLSHKLVQLELKFSLFLTPACPVKLSKGGLLQFKSRRIGSIDRLNLSAAGSTDLLTATITTLLIASIFKS